MYIRLTEPMIRRKYETKMETETQTESDSDRETEKDNTDDGWAYTR